jgi:4a-hydroxytetrahydrobiopterin dehydratase
MSEKGWKAFITAKGLDDWVVLHGGAAAFFSLPSLKEAARFAESVANLEVPEKNGVLISISDAGTSVRLTRDVWQLEAHHIELALAVTRVAQEHSAIAQPHKVQEVQLAIAAKAETISLPFWKAVLGYSDMADDNAVDGLGHSSTVWMQEIAEAKSLRHAMHIDVSVSRKQVEGRLKAAIAAGGTVVDESEAPSHWTLSDPAGNRVCICAWPDGAAQD